MARHDINEDASPASDGQSPDGQAVTVFDELMAGCQPNYVNAVSECLLNLIKMLGEDAFSDVDKEGFTDRVLDLLDPGDNAMAAMTWLCEMSWWCGLPISDAAYARIGEIARAAAGMLVRQIEIPGWLPNRAALRAHTVFAGAFIGVLHSPTRNAIAYARALAALPDTDKVNIFHTGPMTAALQAHAAEVLGPLTGKVRFREVVEGDESFMGEAVRAYPCIYHLWCEHMLSFYPSILSLFGPTVNFVCGDAVPTQYSDVYWFCHEPERTARHWAARGAPTPFIDNYRHVRSQFYTTFAPQRQRTRHELGLRPDEVVIATVGNRIGVDMDQDYVDGVGTIVLQNPNLTWLFVGPLQDYWISAFETVLGSQFRHIPFDHDLHSLLAHVDIFANPFRAGGGNTAVIAIQAGSVVLTRGDVGDVSVLVPSQHWAPDVASYIERLAGLVDDPALRAAWRAEQGANMEVLLDPGNMEREVGELCRIAFERYRARSPVRIEPILALPKGGAVRAA